MDRDGLVTMIESYAKRSTLTTQIEAYFIPLAEARIGRDLKSRENEASEVLSPVANKFAVPADFGSIRYLENEQTEGPFTLLSSDAHMINRFRVSGGDPQRYHISNNLIDVRPFSAGDYNIFYFSRPELAAGGSENGVLTRWPQLYMYGAMIELHTWERDQVARDFAVGVFLDEVRQINKDASRARGDKPAMRVA